MASQTLSAGKYIVSIELTGEEIPLASEIRTVQFFVCVCGIASFPGSAQLFVTCSTEKRGEPGIFSHMSLM